MPDLPEPAVSAVSVTATPMPWRERIADALALVLAAVAVMFGLGALAQGRWDRAVIALVSWCLSIAGLVKLRGLASARTGSSSPAARVAYGLSRSRLEQGANAFSLVLAALAVLFTFVASANNDLNAGCLALGLWCLVFALRTKLRELVRDRVRQAVADRTLRTESNE